jgi:hypothetical protein
MSKGLVIDGVEVAVRGSLLKTVSLRAEYFETVSNPRRFVEAVKSSNVHGDIFTFHQPLADQTPNYDYYREPEYLAVMPITTYEEWWEKQISGKTRNMVRKASKCRVELRFAQLDEDFVRGIKEIYDESPVRQGKPFLHYGRGLDDLYRAHATFAERSQFVGAYLGAELIGFIKLVHSPGISHLMQIIGKIGHRDKAPMNALVGKAVEICADRGVGKLHYGVWSRRGLGDFKQNHAFAPFEIPRYYLPISAKGHLMLRLRLHRKLRERLPEEWVDYLAGIRGRINAMRHGAKV